MTYPYMLTQRQVYTDNTATLVNALERIKALEAQRDEYRENGAAEYARAIDDCVTAMWHSYTEGPEAMEVIMDKLKGTP
jgi:hypothetical protein